MSQSQSGGTGMGTVVECAKCGSTEFDLREFESMMVLCDQLALFGLRCSRCRSHVFAVCVIPHELQPQIEAAAAKLGAGMGRQAPADI
ncbi:MAG: UDP-N-acetylmuramoylalanyl-D-glutamate--2,6-diaminopimelate ligase [Eggerthellaceae bacterium]|nr:UDP-N-acetylmuramoylalanyl-D-glutamate--2,6-diaminopimelate ligase [Eggerthellaceae bacterium]